MHVEALYILGGGILQDGTSWRTTHFTEVGDAFGALGDRLRVDAAAVLAQEHLGAHIIPSGGKGQLRDNPAAPTIARVIARELIALDVSESRIMCEEQSNNTFEQLVQLCALRSRYDWSSVYILTNRWHVPRVKAFIEHCPALLSLRDDSSVSVVAAEDELCRALPSQWCASIAEAYQSSTMQARLAREAQGVDDIQHGRYKFG